MKLFSTTRKEKAYLGAGFLVAAIIISYGAWQDMHPKDNGAGQSSGYSRFYYVGNEADLEHLPQDSNAIVALAGTFTGKGGKNTFTASNIKAVNFPQREADLLFKIDGIPDQLNPLYDAIDKSIDNWHNANNFFNTVYLQDTNPEDSLDKVDNLCLVVRNHLEHNFSINVFLDRPSLEKQKEPKVFIENMGKNVWTYIFDARTDLKQGETLPEMAVDLEKYDAAYMIAVDKKPPSNVLQPVADKLKHFQGFLLMEPETAATEKDATP